MGHKVGTEFTVETFIVLMLDIDAHIFHSLNKTRNTAFRRPWGFCDPGCIMDDVLCARANRSWFHRIFSLFNP